jgi:heat-inducible transcriptional repressor
MTRLTERQETILALIVHEYTEASQPVGSQHLVRRYKLGISSATVRNEMATLTEAGLLRQPYTSAGRVPTEEGYRYFVGRLLGETELPQAEKRLISHQFHQAPPDMQEWVRLAASVLAKQSMVASVVTTPHSHHSIFKHLELIATQGRQVLLVLVLKSGDVLQQMVALPETLSQEQLGEVAEQVARVCSGRDADQVQEQLHHFTGLAKQLAGLLVELMQRADAASAREIHRDGIANVLSQPEFAQPEGALKALRVLEERSFLEEVLSQVLNPASMGGVQVIIGGEGAWEDLESVSMVLARYGAPGYAIGALGVLGPTRMAYGRNISAVRYVAGLMSDLVIETYTG